MGVLVVPVVGGFGGKGGLCVGGEGVGSSAPELTAKPETPETPAVYVHEISVSEQPTLAVSMI